VEHNFLYWFSRKIGTLNCVTGSVKNYQVLNNGTSKKRNVEINMINEEIEKNKIIK